MQTDDTIAVSDDGGKPQPPASLRELRSHWRTLMAEERKEPWADMVPGQPGYEESSRRSAELFAKAEKVIEAAAAMPCDTRDDAAAMLALALDQIALEPEEVEQSLACCSHALEVFGLIAKARAWLEQPIEPDPHPAWLDEIERLRTQANVASYIEDDALHTLCGRIFDLENLIAKTVARTPAGTRAQLQMLARLHEEHGQHVAVGPALQSLLCSPLIATGSA